MKLAFLIIISFSQKYSAINFSATPSARAYVIKKLNSEEIFSTQKQIEKTQTKNMKYTEYSIDNDKIEFLNSILGKETVVVNGEKVSEKFSVTGTEHHFNIKSNHFILKSNYELFKDRKIKIQLIKNDEIVDSKFVNMNSKQRVVWIAFGLLVGYLLVKYL